MCACITFIVRTSPLWPLRWNKWHSESPMTLICIYVWPSVIRAAPINTQCALSGYANVPNEEIESKQRYDVRMWTISIDFDGAIVSHERVSMCGSRVPHNTEWMNCVYNHFWWMFWHFVIDQRSINGLIVVLWSLELKRIRYLIRRASSVRVCFVIL